jgi:dTDP-glucose 4,6-dehydratase
MHVLITGGAGFIGSHFTEMAMDGLFPKIDKITVLDKLTYAGKLENLSSIKSNSNFKFVKGDICDSKILKSLAKGLDAVINFAAESHVDRSILDSGPFIETNIRGTQILLDFVKEYSIQRFVQISTDEVYGSISSGSWDEHQPLKPNSPYAASKASADLLALSYFKTYGLNICITRSSNNFGPRQNVEKLIPSFISRLLQGGKVPLYGDGWNVRDWLFVKDNCRAIYTVFEKGLPGEIYNIGGGEEFTNLELTKKILSLMNKDENMIDFVTDRLGHDYRYSVDFNKIKQIGYSAELNFENNLTETIKWYKKNIKETEE